MKTPAVRWRRTLATQPAPTSNTLPFCARAAQLRGAAHAATDESVTNLFAGLVAEVGDERRNVFGLEALRRSLRTSGGSVEKATSTSSGGMIVAVMREPASGAMALQKTFFDAPSLASDVVKPTSAILAAL